MTGVLVVICTTGHGGGLLGLELGPPPRLGGLLADPLGLGLALADALALALVDGLALATNALHVAAAAVHGCHAGAPAEVAVTCCTSVPSGRAVSTVVETCSADPSRQDGCSALNTI